MHEKLVRKIKKCCVSDDNPQVLQFRATVLVIAGNLIASPEIAQRRLSIPSPGRDLSLRVEPNHGANEKFNSSCRFQIEPCAQFHGFIFDCGC
jgi:hypothetical protein